MKKLITSAVIALTLSTAAVADHAHPAVIVDGVLNIQKVASINIRSYDNQGGMSYFDAARLVKKLGFGFNASMQLMTKIDSNHNHAISRLEAELVDGNHDGYVTADEVRSSMRHYGIKEVSGWW